MATIKPRKNKQGIITSWLVTISGGYGPDGKQIQWLGSELDRKLKELFPDVQ